MRFQFGTILFFNWKKGYLFKWSLHKVCYYIRYFGTGNHVHCTVMDCFWSHLGKKKSILDQNILYWKSYLYSQIILKSNVLCHHCYLPKVKTQVLNINGVLIRLVPCIRFLEPNGTSLLSSPGQFGPVLLP